ncbi:sigma 54-interacting transcriptional regulator [Paraflavisolibacter sp. H34]|uniref:sigma-54-dependent Fis family transcriptional regulator n=1 Tax=Huijunlia imazamoxiresistens TaxID=3127457 RepID=UPI00301A2939
MKTAKPPESHLPVPSPASLERERRVLLDLGNDLTRVREKSDLITLFSNRLKNLYYFTHALVTLIDYTDSTYSALLYDIDRSPIRLHPGYRQLFRSRFPLSEPFIQRALAAQEPLSFILEDVKDQPQSPAYLRVNYEGGIRELLMTKLSNAEKPIGFIHLYSDKVGSFTPEFRSIMNGIAPQLSSAVVNILKNEAILEKEKEKSFLLDFSSDIARVRTKAELQTAISRVLDQTLHTKLAMVQLIEADGIHLAPFLYDRTLFEKSPAQFEALVAEPITVEEHYTAQVLASRDGLLFSVAEEARSGNAFARLWQTTGFRNMYSLPLRAGNQNIGTIWLLADRLSQLMLKGICAQISVAIANIRANEQLLAYKKQLESENSYLKEQISDLYNFSEIIGSGPAMQEVYRLVSLVANSPTTVLILGETGTGKELIARALHQASPRKDQLMVKVNCAALPAHLIESELFGHERGAFTGAIERRIGKFELAHGSTLFLDEIGELPLELQSKLLRVLQERELERLGGKGPIKVDVRLIAATNRHLEEEVRAGRFRADLYFRLNVFPLTLPPLRERPEDLEPLLHFFVGKYSKQTGRPIRKIAPKVLQQLRSYAWPGNVRELEHLVERSVLLAADGLLQEVYLPRSSPDQGPPALPLHRSLKEVERGYIIEVLQRCGGKISGAGGAAEILDLPGNTLHSKMKKLGITKADYFTAR